MTIKSRDFVITSGCLYRLNFPNGKSYIGITTKTADKRFAEHVRYASGRKSKFAVHLAIARYGANAVQVTTLSVAEVGYLKELEVRAIVAFNARPPYGYNLTRGGPIS